MTRDREHAAGSETDAAGATAKPSLHDAGRPLSAGELEGTVQLLEAEKQPSTTKSEAIPRRSRAAISNSTISSNSRHASSPSCGASPSRQMQRALAMRVKPSRNRGWIGLAVVTLVVVIAAGAFFTHHLRWLVERRTLAAGPCDLGRAHFRPGSRCGYFLNTVTRPFIYRSTTREVPLGRLTPAEQQRCATYQRMFPEATIGHVNKAL